MAQNEGKNVAATPNEITQDPLQDAVLSPPAIDAIKKEAGVGKGLHSVSMERSFSQDIKEGSRELKEAAEQTRNIILDLGLDGVIRWVSPSWTDVVGTDLENVKGKPISQFIADNPDVFSEAIESLRSDNSKSTVIRFSIKHGPNLDLNPLLPDQQKADPNDQREDLLELEGQGIIVYDRVSGKESHTMWMLQPPAEPIHVTIAFPERLVVSLGVGAEVLAKYLADLAETGANDPDSNPPPQPVLCRVCERSIVPWWFEKHSDLCVQEHKAELDVQMAQEHLAEHRNAIVKILDAFEARNSRPGSGENSPSLGPIPEYKGLPIGPLSNPSSALSSGPPSHTGSPTRSRSPAGPGLGHSRGRSFAVRRPLIRKVELILDLCDTAMEIALSTIKEAKADADDDFQSQSPRSESRISQVLHWQPQTGLENEPGLAALSVDTERMARAKVEAIHRHREIIEYSERIRQEYMAAVDICIAEALEKFDRAAAGEPISSSSESEAEPEQQLDVPDEEFNEEPTPLAEEPPAPQLFPYVGIRAMASAMKNPADMSEQRRSSSAAVSSRSSSPMECPTPRSHRSALLGQPAQPAKRASIYADSEANDSDASLPSSITGPWRTESPASDQGLSRTASSRDRKRRSMHLYGLGAASPHRQHSPARYPQPPLSPLRTTKPRLPSGESMPSPIVSPLLTTGEFMPPHLHSFHHRRQSSVHSSEIRPGSPHLSSINQPQPKAQPPSIKDFEIIKPISKGAFGSVYLSKKKLTGDYFAIKVLRKADMVAKNQVTNVKAERAIMMWQGESDFVAKLYWTFSSKEYLYLVMEYLNGGDCASLVKVLGGLSEDWAKKYVAEVVLGVEHLHSRGIVHRDLKPDNLLIDSKGHLKVTDFGLSRMGLVGRQKRVLKSPEATVPDLLKQGPFTREESNLSSRSASFDYLGSTSPNQTPLMTPALTGGLDQPSYFSLGGGSSLSRELSRKSSGHRSDFGGGSMHDLHSAFRSFSVHDVGDVHGMLVPHHNALAEDEQNSQGSASPDLFPLSQSMSNISQAPAAAASTMLPPPMALFDPQDNSRRFVGTPDYLAPETINGSSQDEMSDWWSLGCILFEFLFGYPPFNADTTDEVFDNILNRKIAWPEDLESLASSEARDLIDRLIQIDPQQRIGANKEEKYPTGAAEIKAHPWFSDVNWDTLLEDEAQFVPNPENPEDTEYFDARGATLQSFPEEFEDQISPANVTPGGTEYAKRPHDALLHTRNQVNNLKRGLMPLHIPPHVARDSRNRRLSEPVVADDFGNFTYKNLPVLEKANKDIVNKMREEAMQAQSRNIPSQAVSIANSPITSSPGPSLEGSPMLQMPLQRAISVNRGHQRGSPSGPNLPTSSPSRPSQPSSPLLVQFSTRQHERRKTSASSSQSSGSLQPGNFFDLPQNGTAAGISATSSPIKTMRMPAMSPGKLPDQLHRAQSFSSRSRSQTVSSQEGEGPRENFVSGHYKRRSQLFANEISPSSSDNENNPQAKALLKVQRRRQSSRRFSQINMTDGPFYRPLDVLICEDHPVSRMVMERLFEKLRCRTITAVNGSDAMRLAVSQITFDIIMMEYKLPMINGIDVARMIRDTTNANTRTPIVAVTGYLKELPDVHQFDALIQKPPTLTKLTEALCKYCSWKPPPKDFKMFTPLTIPSAALRQEAQNSQDSPSSVASSMAPTMPDSSYRSSSRENSAGSSFFGDMESIKAEDIPPVIISRQPTADWTSSGGLGITENMITDRRPYLITGLPHLIHTESAPVSATGTTPPVFGLRTPRRKISGEGLKAKRETLEKKRADRSGAESGDDEDEELGDIQVRTRSPIGKGARQASRLGHEMMRTNSRGSVISTTDDGSIAEPAALRRSLELIEQKMEGLQIPEESDASVLATVQPRKLERTISQHSHPEHSENMTDRPVSRGHITPPVIFPQKPGTVTKEIDMDAEITPVPSRTIDLEEEPTPRPQGSPSEKDLRVRPR